MSGSIRKKTGTKNIYYNNKTKKYDIKYNYKIYNPVKKKNEYKAKWTYGINTITEAKQELALLTTKGIKNEDKDITLEGIFNLWKTQAEATNKSKVTIRNTQQQYNMLIQHIDKNIKLRLSKKSLLEKNNIKI